MGESLEPLQASWDHPPRMKIQNSRNCRRPLWSRTAHIPSCSWHTLIRTSGNGSGSTSGGPETAMQLSPVCEGQSPAAPHTSHRQPSRSVSIKTPCGLQGTDVSAIVPGNRSGRRTTCCVRRQRTKCTHSSASTITLVVDVPCSLHLHAHGREVAESVERRCCG